MLNCKFIVSFEHFIKAIIIVSRSLANGEKGMYVSVYMTMKLSKDVEGGQRNKKKVL